MSAKTNFYLNGNLVNPPQNWKELSIELNFDREKFEATKSVSINEWDFVRENADTVNKWVEDGTTGGVGIFEAIPLKIEIDRNGVIEKPFDGYLELPDGNYSCNKTSIPSKERQQIDWLNDVADSFTFEYLFREAGTITKDDFIFQPYVISAVPDYKESAIALLSAFILKTEIERAIDKIKELSAEMSNPFEATAIIRAILYIAYLTTLILALIKLIKDVITFIIQPVKYHACMKVKIQLEKGCEHLGLTFASPIFDDPNFKDMVIMPEKFYNPVNSADKRILGYTIHDKDKQEGFFKGTFGDLLRLVKSMFNAKIIIDNGVLTLIRRDEATAPPLYQLPDLYQPYHRYNANEMKSNYYITFQTDLSDANTIQQYQGTSYQVTVRPSTIINSDLVLTKNLKEVRIPLALAKRKEELTIPEQIIKEILDVFSALLGVVVLVINALIAVANVVIKTLNKIIKALNVVGIKVSWQIQTITPLAPISLGSLIDNRIGMMLLQTDFFNNPKVFIISEGSKTKFNKLHILNSQIVSAKYLYDNYHFIESFVPSTDRPNGNQYIIKEYEKVPFCFEDYQNVKQNNSIFVGSEKGEIENLKWNPYQQHADMRVRISKLYTTNLIETFNEPTGI
jgi:hypothetical protein